MKTGLELLRDIENEETTIPLVYYLYGDESYLIDKAVKAIEDIKLASSSLKGLNHQVFYAPKADPSEIIGCANTLPAFSRWRVVLVKDAHLFSQEQLKIFLPYFKSPSPATLLIFTGEKADMRKGFFIEVNKKDGMVNFPLLKRGQLAYWLKKETSGRGKNITPEAMNYLIDIVGNSLRELSQEIEKLSLYVGDKKAIGLKDIEEVGTDMSINNIFDFTDAVGTKNLIKALTALRKLLLAGEPPYTILAMVERHFRILWRIKMMIEKGMDNNGIGKRLGLSPYIMRFYLKQGKPFSIKELKGIFNELYLSDLAVKTGKMPFKLVLEKLSIRLCGMSNRPAYRIR
ncbi:MAG: DNA polymerase III subunit delta [Thermodesulfobacteriota bacterium]